MSFFGGPQPWNNNGNDGNETGAVNDDARDNDDELRDAEPVDGSATSTDDGRQETEQEDNGTAENHAADDAGQSDATEKTERKAARKTKARRGDTVQTVSAETVEKLERALEALRTERGATVARIILETSEKNPYRLAALLTEKKNHARAVEMISALSTLGDDDESLLRMNLLWAFTQNAEMPKLLFALMNAGAEGNPLGRPSGDARKDALAAAARWELAGDFAELDALKF